MKNVLVVLLLTVLVTTGCSQAQQKAMIGTVLGSVAGQAIGNNTESTLIGAGAGTLLGYVFGNEQDKNKPQNIQNVPSHNYQGRNGQYDPQYRGATSRQQYRDVSRPTTYVDSNGDRTKIEYTHGGHWVVTDKRVWVDGFTEQRSVEPLYGVSDPEGHTLPSIIRQGYFKTIVTPGSWSTQRVRTWVPDRSIVQPNSK